MSLWHTQTAGGTRGNDTEGELIKVHPIKLETRSRCSVIQPNKFVENVNHRGKEGFLSSLLNWATIALYWKEILFILIVMTPTNAEREFADVLQL